MQADSSPYKHEVLYVFKMNLPFDAYDRKAFQSLAQKIPCYGNEADECVASGGVELFTNGATAKLPAGQSNDVTEGREIQGKLISHDSQGFSVQGSSGKVIKFTMKSDVIATYNTERAAKYNNIRVNVGDMISVRYIEAPNLHNVVIDQTQISTMMYMLEMLNKTAPIKKY